jgi:hypothetical protein
LDSEVILGSFSRSEPAFICLIEIILNDGRKEAICGRTFYVLKRFEKFQAP